MGIEHDCCVVLSRFTHVHLFGTLQAPLSMRFFRQEYWSDPPGSSVHGVSQARMLEWVAIFFSRDLQGSSQFPVAASGFFTTITTSILRTKVCLLLSLRPF